MAKPDRSFHVEITRHGKTSERRTIKGETFHAARAAFCASAPDVEPGHVRLDVEAQGSAEGMRPAAQKATEGSSP